MNGQDYVLPNVCMAETINCQKHLLPNIMED